jgi:hypothetical protein
MRKYLFITAIIALVIDISLSAQIDQKQSYEKIVKKYTNIRNGGIALTFAGFGTTAAGVGFIASSLKDYPHNETKEDIGTRCIVVSVFMVAGGITLWSMGSHIRRDYKRLLKNFSFDIKSTYEYPGLQLTFSF